MIKVCNLTMGWSDAVLQKDASFEVAQGDVFVILGRSGCGKSTMLRHLIGLDAPLQGEIWVQGQPMGELKVGRPRFGVMFQAGALFGSMTVGENVALSLQEWTDLPREAIDAIVHAKLHLVGLNGVSEKFPSELSGGMKKRAAIARAMALEPNLLFLDEPSAGLDPVSAAEFDELILTLNKDLGLTVVLVSHELESILKIAKNSIMLDKESQSIIARGDPRKLKETSEDERVHKFFNRVGEGA